MGKHLQANRGGYALIMTIWVLVFLTIVAMSFNLSSRLSRAMTRNFKEETQAYYLAMTGYHEILRLIQTDKDPAVDFIDEEGHFYLDKESAPIPERIVSDDGVINIKVQDEEGRLNINRINEALLRRVLHNIGIEPETEDELVDSLKDWLDPDDLHRLNGAEDEYYTSLGYSTKNGRLDSIDELLLIKGFSSDILYGKGGKPGLKTVFTTFGSGGLNINTSNKEIMSILGLSDLDIETVMSQRTVTIGGYRMIPPQFTRLGFSKTATTYFRIKIEGRPSGSTISYNIDTVIKRRLALKGFETETLYWREDVSYNSSENKT